VKLGGRTVNIAYNSANRVAQVADMALLDWDDVFQVMMVVSDCQPALQRRVGGRLIV